MDSYGGLFGLDSAVKVFKLAADRSAQLEQTLHLDTKLEERLDSRERLLRLNSLAFTTAPVRLVLADGCDLQTFQLQDNLWKQVQRATVHNEAIMSVTALNDVIVTVGRDRKCVASSGSDLSLLAQMLGHSWVPFGLAISDSSSIASGLVVASGGGIWDKRVLVWDLQRAQDVVARASSSFGQAIFGSALSWDCQQLLTTGHYQPRAVHVWKTSDLTTPHVAWDGDGKPVTSIGYHPGMLCNEQALIVGANGSLKAYKSAGVTFQQLPDSMAMLDDWVCTSDVAVFPDGRHFAVIGKGLAICDGIAGTIVNRMPDVTGQRLTLSHDGSRLVVTQKQQAMVWRTEPLQLIGIISTPDGVSASVLYGIAVSPDGSLLALAYHDHTVRLWTMHNLQCVATLPLRDRAYAVTFTSDSQFVVCGGDDKVLSIWDCQGRPVTRLYMGASIGMLRVGLDATLWVGDDFGRINKVVLHSPDLDLPFVTAAQVWNPSSACYELRARCPYTGTLEAVPPTAEARSKHFQAQSAASADLSWVNEAYSHSDLVVASLADKQNRQYRLNWRFARPPNSMTTREVAQVLLLEVTPADKLKALRFVAFKEGKEAGRMTWLAASDVVGTSAFYSPAQGQALPAGSRVVAKHPNYSSSWDARIGNDGNDTEVCRGRVH